MSSLRLLLTDIWENFGFRVIAIVLLTALVGLSEGIGTALLFPLLTRIGVQATPPSGVAGKFIMEWGGLFDPHDGPGAVLVVLVVILLLQAMLSILLNWRMASMQRGYTARWQNRLFAACIRAEWKFLAERKAGALVSIIATETGRLAAAFMTLAQLFATLVVTLVYCGFALIVSWQATLALVALAGVLVVMGGRLLRKSHRIGRGMAADNSRLQVLASEYLSGAKLVKALTAEGRAIAAVAEVTGRIEHSLRLATFVPAVMRSMFEVFGLLGFALLMVYGTQAMNVAPANILVVLALFARLFPRFNTLQSHLHNLSAHAPAIIEARNLVEAAESECEPTADSAVPPLEIALPTHLSIQSLHAGFGKQDVLHGVTTDLPVPGFTGIVGESGTGKSTLVHCLMRLVPIRQGKLWLGKSLINQIPLSAWRRSIGFVPQETIFFHASVRENMLFAKPDATQVQIESATKRAHAHEFIQALPQGYETVIGDQGVSLSGGQRQRLGIARALLTEPRILIMDEPTSALDSETEAEVMATLESLRETLGIIVVAHRLATVRGADKIVVLASGRVAEEGSWDDLMKENGRLRALAEFQNANVLPMKKTI